MLGSGVVIVIDDRTCMVQLALRTARVLRPRELRQVHAVPRGHALGREILRRIEWARPRQDELDLLLNVCDRIEGKCLCPLGDAWRCR